MQNKGIVKFFAIALFLISIYQLSFTFVGNKLEDQAKAYAKSKVDQNLPNKSDLEQELEVAYLDSLKKVDVFAGFTGKEVQKNELKLGLDLKGGINVLLEVSVKDILIGLADESQNAIFRKALDETTKAQADSQDSFIDIFFDEFKKVSNGKVKLNDPYVFGTRALVDGKKINELSDADVESVIRAEVDGAIDQAFIVIKTRIDQFGVAQPKIQKVEGSDRIIVELPGAKNVERIKKLLQNTAKLEFWFAAPSRGLQNYVQQVNAKLKEEQDAAKPKEEEKPKEEVVAPADTTDGSVVDVNALTTDEDAAAEKTPEELAAENPFFRIFTPTLQGPILGYTGSRNLKEVLHILNERADLRTLLPEGYQNVKFLAGKTDENTGSVAIYSIASNRAGEAPLDGDVITNANNSFSQNGSPTVSMQMDNLGASKWEEMTGEAFNTKGNIAIVLDNTVYSAPGVTTGAIAGGRSEISGNFTVEEAKDLANVLKAGKLPAPARIVQSDIVGPSLGQEAIDSGMMSFGIALFIVLLWIIFYYGKAGLFADGALLLNLVFIFGVLASFAGATLTLPGIAGIVLTIGMSVDANVLIFERIREELAKGKGQKDAIKDGFSNALSSILDANITTGLTGIILLFFGSGPVKGFATTLLIGIATSLFSAIFITRLFIDWYINRGNKLDFATSITKNWFKGVKVDFLAKRKIAYAISALIIAGGIYSLATIGLNKGVDFTGGRTYTVHFENATNPEEVRVALKDVFKIGNVSIPPEVKTSGRASRLKITTKYKIESEDTTVDAEIEGLLFNGLQKFLPDGFTKKEFVNNDDTKTIGIMEATKVGPTIADDLQRNSFWAVFGSLFVVFLYILLRFRKWQFSLGAVIAVFHDVLIVLGLFSILWKYVGFNMEVNQAFIAAALTVIGYSLNDTVVIFDRIRENLGLMSNSKLYDVVNDSLSSTLSRTLNTSITTLLVLLAIFFFGGDSIKGFIFALLVGVVVGTYSSLFVASPIMYDTYKKKTADKA
jgi:SecD/SecF fusion protein